MRISTMILGTLFFALAVVILYIWGMKKQQSQPKDLMNLLYSKGQKIVKDFMKDYPEITQYDVEQLCDGLTARLPFSTNKAIVTDKKDFAEKLLAYMVKTGQLKKQGKVYVKEK